MAKKSNKKTNLDEILAAIPEDRQAIAADIVDELKFLQKMLAQLKDIIQERGVVELYPKGKMIVLRESPAVRSLNQGLQKFSLLYKQLEGLLPKSDSSKYDELADFLQAQNRRQNEL